MNLTKALKQIRPTQQSQGSMQPGCQHLSLVKGSLPDNVTLITESPDSDFLSFSVQPQTASAKAACARAHPHARTYTRVQSTLLPPQNA